MTGKSFAETRPSGPFVGVSAVVVRSDRVLVGRRRGSHGAGTWAFPGGKLEAGEHPGDAVRRELTEETGLVADHVGPITWTSEVIRAEGGDLHFITLHHLVSTHPGEPQLREPDKTDGWLWYAVADIPQPIFAPAASLLATGWAPPPG